MEDFLNLPKISFIVITHNFSDFVCDCLNSIKNQTYKNYEIIVVDDYSADDTFEKISKFQKENKGIMVQSIKNEKNIGQMSSFLEGLKIAKGEFVCLIDGDDVLFPEYAAIHIETHLKTPVALTSCLQAEIDEHNIIHSFSSAESPIDNKTEFEVENKTFEEFNNYRKASGIETKGALIKVLDADKYSFASWHWGPSSSAVMRKSVCDMLLKINDSDKLKITADKFIFSFCHLIGSSAVINKTLFAYRRHNSNYSLANPIMGNKKYLKETTQKRYIRNNKKIRIQMFDFIKENQEFFMEKLNKTNVMLLYKRIIFSFDLKFFRGLIKSLFI